MKTNFTAPGTPAEIAERMDFLRSEISRMQAELNFLDYSFELMTKGVPDRSEPDPYIAGEMEMLLKE